MKYTLILLFPFLCCCNNSTVSNKLETSKLDSTNSTVNKCVLTIDTFAFKNIKIGMNVSELKNIKKTQNNYIDSPEIENQCKISTYSVTNIADYTIFEKKIKEIDLSFFNDDLFEIRIKLRDNIISDLAKKFNAASCAENLYEPNKIPALSLSNNKFTLSYMGIWSTSLANSTNIDPVNYYLTIYDNKVNEIVDYCLKQKREDKNNKRIQDF